MKTTTVQVPGKVFLAGEHAVMYGKKAIIFPVNQTLSITVKNSEHFYIQAHTSHPFNDDLNGLKQAPLLHAIVKTMQQHIQPFTPVNITIKSTLDDKNQRSLGLGSSGALTTGLVEALLKHFNQPHNPHRVFKLAVTIQQGLGIQSSFGDLALTAFKTPVVYQMFTSVHEIDQPWPDLIIQPINLALPPLTIVNTGIKADSKHYIQAINRVKDEPCFKHFLNESDALVNTMIDTKKLTLPMVISLHKALLSLERCAKTTLWTPAMETINAHCDPYHTALKFSGAGGGDNVLIFSKNHGIKKQTDLKLTKTNYNPTHLQIRT